MRKIALLASAISGCMLAATAADARDFTLNRGVLGYADGIASTLDRIDQFTDQVCKTNGRVGIYARRVQEACKKDLTAEIVSDIGDRRLNAAAADHLFMANN